MENYCQRTVYDKLRAKFASQLGFRTWGNTFLNYPKAGPHAECHVSGLQNLSDNSHTKNSLS